MAVQAQRAGWSFLVPAVPLALVAGLVASWADGAAGGPSPAVLVGGACLAYGALLGLLARRGFLPISDSAG